MWTWSGHGPSLPTPILPLLHRNRAMQNWVHLPASGVSSEEPTWYTCNLFAILVQRWEDNPDPNQSVHGNSWPQWLCMWPKLVPSIKAKDFHLMTREKKKKNLILGSIVYICGRPGTVIAILIIRLVWR